MLFSVGTKVKLLNTNDEGTIKELLSDGMVKVRLKNGFVIPVHERDLKSLIDFKKIPPSPQPQSIGFENKPKTQYTILKSKGIQIAFEPLKGLDGTTKSFKVYLINDTTYDFTFDLELSFLNDSPIKTDDILQATSYLRVATIRYDQLNDAPIVDIKGRQISTAGTGAPLHKTLKIKAKTFFSKMMTAPLINQPSYLYVLFDNFGDEQKKEENLFQYAKRNTKAQPPKGDQSNPFYKLNSISDFANFSLELDLHIEKLKGNFKKMDNGEILNHQLNALERYITEALKMGVDNVFIIHGIGKGKLKEAVQKQLAKNPHIQSFKNEFHPKYGWGATEVIFKD